MGKKLGIVRGLKTGPNPKKPVPWEALSKTGTKPKPLRTELLRQVRARQTELRKAEEQARQNKKRGGPVQK